MAQQLYFSRDSQMFLEIGSQVWKIPVLEGFSFSQATNTSEITLAEMEATDGTSRRGRRAFNDSLAPVDFSFSTYIRPFTSAGSGAGAADSAAEVHAVEEALWALFSGPAVYDNSAGDHLFTDQTVPGSVISTLSFDQSNTSTLGPDAGANLYFELGDANKICYKLSKVAINEASIDFDIDGVAQINWTGFADTIADVSKYVTVNVNSGMSGVDDLVVDSGLVAADLNRRIHGTGMTADIYIDAFTNATTASLSADQTIADDTILSLLGPRATIYEGIDQTNNFIRNRLTKCIIIVKAGNDPQSKLEDGYDLTLTGGNITLSNNITYLTPEELGTVNIPIGHVTGARAFGGSMTCYLTEKTDGVNSSRDFFEDLVHEDQRTEVSNNFSIEFLIGGGDVVNPGLINAACSATDMATTSLAVLFEQCHVDIPTHSIEDIITLESTFMALPSTIELADEVVMRYKGPAK
jgi:hypothetical protein